MEFDTDDTSEAVVLDVKEDVARGHDWRGSLERDSAHGLGRG
jgi:hypothetical protein